MAPPTWTARACSSPPPSTAPITACITITYYSTDSAGHTEAAHSTTVEIEAPLQMLYTGPIVAASCRHQPDGDLGHERRHLRWQPAHLAQEHGTNAWVRVTPAGTAIAANQTSYSVP